MSHVRIEDGEAEAFLAGERPRLRRYLTAMTRDAAEAEDLTQETLVRAWRGLPQLREPQAARAWLYQIATNVMVERARADQRRIITMANDTVPAGPPTTDEGAIQLEQADMSACVNDLTDRLSDAQRAVLLLHDAHGFSNPQIAALLGCSLPAVKIRLHRARARLTRMVEEHCQVGNDDRGVLICEPAPGAVNRSPSGDPAP
jgi:RNA polymerase sigma-70 factor (ECF subfamily)